MAAFGAMGVREVRAGLAAKEFSAREVAEDALSRIKAVDPQIHAFLEVTEEAAYAQLYPRIRREAIIYHGIVHHTPLDEINDKLFEENEKALC